MQLLVSVTDPSEVPAALAGGADIIDAKDVSSGALGAVSLDVLRKIHSAVDCKRTFTAAAGDAFTEHELERRTNDFALAGAEFIKVGFAGISSRDRIRNLVAAAARGARLDAGGHAGIVAVAYADADRDSSVRAEDLAETAASAGAAGVLVDTMHKLGPGLCSLVTPRVLTDLVTTCRALGLFVALAGRVSAVDLPMLVETGADIVGVRGAACDDGRTGRISAERVSALRTLCPPSDMSGLNGARLNHLQLTRDRSTDRP